MVLARSIARIHETNLKKQGILPLTFANENDYAKIDSGDLIDTIGLNELIRGDAGAQLKVRVKKPDGQEEILEVKHTMSSGQIGWLKAGSALNAIAQTLA
jgi:homoaconitase